MTVHRIRELLERPASITSPEIVQLCRLAEAYMLRSGVAELDVLTSRPKVERAAVQAAIEKLPPFDLNWKDEIKDRWFECVNNICGMMKP